MFYWRNTGTREWKDCFWNSRVKDSGINMHILRATIIKDLKILRRDRVGLFMMFFMPILLVVVITSVQNSAFELVNNNKISLIVFNKDKGLLGGRMVEGLQKTGLFNMKPHDSLNPDNNITSRM